MSTLQSREYNIKTKGILALSLSLFFVNTFSVFGQARLVLDGGVINITQGAYLVIDNPAPDAITVNSGFIVSEGENNSIKWNIGTTTGTYTIPWGYGGTGIPLVFTKTAGTGSGYFIFSTFHTVPQNSSQLPASVANINGASGADNSLFASDRFWQMSALGYALKPTLSDVAFVYLDAENVSPNTIIESDLHGYRYNSTLNKWTDHVLSNTVNTSSNTVTVSSVDAANLYDWWAIGTLGSNRYWVAPSNSTSNLTANWSETSGGPGNAGVPTYQDALIFDAGSTFDVSIDANVTAASVLVDAGYTGTITQGANTITLTNTGVFSGGTFAGGSGDISIGGAFVVSGAAFTSTSGTLDLQNNLSVNSGSFAHNNGTVKFSGTSAVSQEINGSLTSNFNNILVTNTSATPGLRIQSNQNLLGVLTLAGNVTFDADGSSNTSVFKLISTADSPTQDAAIAILPSGAQVTGDVAVQRFMTKEGRNNTRIYRYISSPVQSAQVADLQNEIPVTGSFTGTSVCSTCTANQSMFAYDESVITDTNGSGTSDFDDGYIDFPNTSNAETLTPGKGYAMFVSGNILSSTAWDVRGPINAGNVTPITLPVGYTSTGNILNDGWNLVGNPFPSTLDWNSSSGWTKTNLEASIYITDNGNTVLQYATWNGSIGTNGGSRYIATGQAFWTKANGSGAPVLQASENTKASGTQSTFFREGSFDDLLRITMYKGVERDETVVHFRQDATRGFDPNFDARKLKNGSFNLSSLTEDGELLAINSTSPLNCSTSIKLSVKDAVPGQYSLKFTNLDSFVGAQISLNDRFLSQSIPVTENLQYSFAVTTAAASSGNDRFVLIVNKNPLPVVIQSTGGTLIVDYTTGIQWYYNDQLIPGATMPTLTPVQPGTYRVVIQYGGCELSGSIDFMITGVIESLPPGINVFPNPVTNDVFITTDRSSIESVVLMNMLGTILEEIQLTNVQGHQTVKFDMEGKSAGLYILRIVERNNIYIRKFIKE